MRPDDEFHPEPTTETVDPTPEPTPDGHAAKGDATEIATLGGGCFWCLDAVYRRMQGIRDVTCGYAAGHQPDPTYRQVCTGTTGHAEVVQVAFDPEEISFREILQIFFTIHDPTTRDRQGNDVGTQYRSIILHHSPEQAATAREVMEWVAGEEMWGAPLVTQVEPLETFYAAEPEHQDYFARNPHTGYCQAVVAPKVAKARSAFAHRFPD
ncbi:MAG: peptide-methionine (S)-S-oxide reductase [Gemmatimonadales bacterium]|nr:MAG: peptide-methionine (S)-S-oxide reductase [Gemmatimonadales bacterium]